MTALKPPAGLMVLEYDAIGLRVPGLPPMGPPCRQAHRPASNSKLGDSSPISEAGLA